MNGWRMVGLLLTMVWVLVGCEEAGEGTEPRIEWLEDVASITVRAELDGGIVSQIEGAALIGELLEGLRAAEPSYIESPEFHGAVYEVVLRAQGGGEQRLRVNDVRSSDTLEYSGKVYVHAENGEMSAREVNVPWLAKLLGSVAFDTEKPKVSVVEISGSVIVQANRRIQTDSVHTALKSLKAETLSGEAAVPDYTVSWSDPYRFVVRFAKVEENVTLRMRFDDLLAAGGESFADGGAGIEAVVNEEGTKSRLLWVNLAGDLVQRRLIEPGVLVQPIRGIVLRTVRQASHIGKSNGFLFVYPMTWVDDDTVVVPWSSNEKAHINGTDGSMELVEDPELPPTVLELLAPHLEENDDAVRFLPRPTADGKAVTHYAVQTLDQANWLVDTAAGQVLWLGEGNLITWVNAEQVLLWDAVDDGPLSFNIGMDVQ